MPSNKSRSRLLAGASLSAVLTMFASQPAWADCAIAAGAVTCGTTVTTNTTSDGVTTPSTDREFRSAVDLTGTINGAVTGFGLAFTNTADANALNVVNNGSVQVDPGLTPTAGGTAALDLSATGTVDINYSGAGDILNLGTGDGLAAQTDGTGRVTLNVGGDVRADAGDAVHVVSTDANGGDALVFTGSIQASGGDGIDIASNGTGAVLFNNSLVAGATITSGGAGANTLENGIIVTSSGTGNVLVTNVAAIGTATDRAQISGISASIDNALSRALLLVQGNGNIFTAGIGIAATNSGTSRTTVNYDGAIDSLGSGVNIISNGGGAISVELGAVKATGGTAVEVEQNSLTRTGGVSIVTNDTIEGFTGIDARNHGLGQLTVTITAAVTGTVGSAIIAVQDNIAAVGDVTITVGAGGATSTDAPVVDVQVAGTGDLSVVSNGDLTGNGTNGDGIVAIHNGTAGNVSVTTAGGTTISAGATGIIATIDNAASTGAVTITNGADVVSSGAAGSLARGIDAFTNGLGALTVVNTGAIGSLADRTTDEGIIAQIGNTLSTAALSVTGSGNIFAADDGLTAINRGTGTTTVNYTGAIDSDLDGAFIQSQGGGAINVTLGAVTGTGGTAVTVQQTKTTGTGAISVTTNGVITGETGIEATNSGLGGITILTTALVTGTNGSAIGAIQNNAASTGNILVTVGAGGASASGDAVIAGTAGSGTVTVNSSGPVTSDIGDGITTGAQGGATTINITGGSVDGGDDGISALSTTGSIDVRLSGGADVTGVNSGITVTSAGVKTVVVGAGSVVTGAEAISASGGSTLNVNNVGMIGTTGAVAVVTDGNTRATITIQQAGVMNGRLSLSNLNDIVASVGTWNADGIQNFSAGVDLLDNRIAGILNVAAGTTFTGLENVTNAGTATLGTGVTFTGLIAFANSGTLNATGGMVFDGGNNALTNSGTANLGGTIDFAGGIDVLANLVGGTVNIASGTSLLGLETLNNDGTFNATAGLTFDGGATTLNNRFATGIFNAGGVIDFGAGADVLNNLNGATLNAAAGTSLLGLETLNNSGAFNALAGLTLDAGNTAMTNAVAGTVNLGGAIDFGAGADSLTNAGIVNFAVGSSLLGLETLTNSGVLLALGGLTFDATSTTVTNNGNFNLGGTINLGDGNDSLVNSGNITAQGTIDFGAGADSFANNSLLHLIGNLTIAGLETFTTAVASRINLNNFTLTGSAIAFTNNGFIDTSGNAGLLGFTSITNAATGTIDLAAGTLTVGAGTFTNNGTILADEGLSTITGQTGFTNSGTINLRDGVVGDRLTLGTGGFTGLSGSTLRIDVNSTTADVLAIAGAAAGATVIDINSLNDITINSGGILVVDTGTSTSNTAFSLASTFGTPLIDLGIRRVDADYFLVALPNATALDPLSLINIGQDMWQQSADIYGNYAALKRTDLKAGAKSLGLWGQAYMSRDRIGARNDSQSVFNNDIVVNQHARTERRGIQVGVDHNFGMAVVGVTAGWQKAEAEVRDAITEVDGKGYNVGAYAILGSATGLYGGLLVKYDRNTLDMDNDVLDAVDRLTSRSIGVEGEFGYRIPIGSSTLDLGAGLAMVRTNIEDFSLANIDYDYRTAKTLRGRLGARFDSAVGVFLDTKLFHDFRDDNDLVMRSGTEADTIDANGKGTWFRGELGYGKPGSAGPIGALWVNAGDVHGFGAKLGYRF